MNKFAQRTILIILAVASMACSGSSKPAVLAQSEVHNFLTDQERAEGWILLFDGKTFNGWRGLGREGIPEGHWVIDNGTIRKVPSRDVPLQADGQPLTGGDLMTAGAFENFELYLEWKISSAGNSGIKYNVSEEMSTSSPPLYAALGFEYQILDDEKHPDAQNGPDRTAAALYDLIAPENKIQERLDRFNFTRIILNGNHGEHWLNGVKVLEFDLETPRMDRFLAASKYRSIEGFSDRRPGHIVLQDHTDEVWFRNIKIRELTPDR